jgi:ABC-2 type transport system ATP-binding protein
MPGESRRFDVPRGSDLRAARAQRRGQIDADQHPRRAGDEDRGRRSIWGFDIDADPRNAKASIGIVPQELVFDPFFTPFETLENQAGLYGVPKAEAPLDGAAARRASRTRRMPMPARFRAG